MGRASDQFEAQLASPHELEGEAVNAHAVASCCFVVHKLLSKLQKNTIMFFVFVWPGLYKVKKTGFTVCLFYLLCWIVNHSGEFSHQCGHQ